MVLQNTRTMALDDDLTFLAWSGPRRSHQRLDKHLVGYSTIQFVEDGTLELAYDDDIVAISEPSFFPAYPGPRLRFHPLPGDEARGWVHRHLAFQGPRFLSWVASGLWPTRAQLAPPGIDAGSRFDGLTALASQPDRWSRLRAVHALEGLLLDLAQARAAAAGERGWLAEVLATLETHDSYVPDYHEVARELGVSVPTLRRRFKEATGGQTLHEWVLERRMARARQFLGESDLPLRTIAERLGYASEFYLARQFKERVGTTPGAYRRSRV